MPNTRKGKAVRKLPYEQLPFARAKADEETLVAAFHDAEVHWEISKDERFCVLTHHGVSWTVVNADHLSTVAADEQNSGIRITRIIDRPLTPSELLALNKALTHHGCR
ncbi:hypothetical protein [Streptomyces sp. NPDC059010]|uniref:hypothetical protein n=1 Tax=Streptomyces sp. NPDC059010 TaxID=3346695 RepID=UPI0036A087B6